MVMRGSSVIAFDSGVPSKPTRSTSTPIDDSACAWYCMRALRPRSPSATATALIREWSKGLGSHFTCDQPHASLHRHVRPRPLAEDGNPVAEADEPEDVEEQPEHPG